MAKEKLADLLKDEPSIGPVEAIREGIQAVAPGLSLHKILSDVGTELSHQLKAGAHELSAALLRDHDGFVMYPRIGQENEGHGQPEAPQQEQDCGGREM
jgi:hypothetical protein